MNDLCGMWQNSGHKYSNCYRCAVGGQRLLKQPLSLAVLILEHLVIQPKCSHLNIFF